MKEEMSDSFVYEEGDIVFVDEYECKKAADKFLVILDKLNMYAVRLENFAMLSIYKKDNEEGKIDELFKEVIALPKEWLLYKAGKVCKDLLEEYKESYIRFLDNN